jgi:hypothetical protein
MAEWSKAAVLKTVECNSSVGSNPTPSAIPVFHMENFCMIIVQITVKA